jgi:hypothetical protein
MLDDIVTAGGDALAATAAAPDESGDEALTYKFTISEGETDEGALLVTLRGALPEGIDAPTVEIEGWTCETSTVAGQFVYSLAGSSPKVYLTAADGQAITGRTLVLPGMDVLQRQDAKARLRVERNRHLVNGRDSADAFVYETADVTFPGPLFPTVVSDEPLDLATLGSTTGPVTRPLSAHLTALFDALLVNNSEPLLTFQVEVSYRYPLNPKLSDVQLPVFFQPPLKVDVTAGPTTMIDAWVTAITAWLDTQKPTSDGVLGFDLYAMSNLTTPAMPLLRLPALFLEMAYVS